MRPERRKWITHTLALAAAPALVAVGRRALAQATGPEQVVRIVAQRFQYTPSQFDVKAGQPVLLEFTAVDFAHGFHMPDLKLRADLSPDKVTQVRFTVDKPGVYEFLCDNFCGDDHENMNGRMNVLA